MVRQYEVLTAVDAKNLRLEPGDTISEDQLSSAQISALLAIGALNNPTETPTNRGDNPSGPESPETRDEKMAFLDRVASSRTKWADRQATIDAAKALRSDPFTPLPASDAVDHNAPGPLPIDATSDAAALAREAALAAVKES